MAKKISTSADELLEMCHEAIGQAYPDATPDRPWNPLIEMAVFANDPELPRNLKAGLNKELANYFYAKKKAVEHTGDSQGTRVMLVKYSEDNPDQIEVLGEQGAPVDPNKRAPVLIQQEPKKGE